MYSVERFYEVPQLSDLVVAASTVSFSTASSYKRQNPSTGEWKVTDDSGAVLGSGVFTFRPYWRPANIVVSLPAALPAGVPLTVTVTDEWGKSATLSSQ